MIKSSICFLLLVVISAISHSQVCNENMTATTDPAQFIVNDDGTVIDAVNFLIWDKCSLGQVYQDGQCLGAPTNFSTWQEALSAAAAVEGKYLPNLKELATIVERSCYEPSISQAIFSDTPLAMYWSSTPDELGSTLAGRIIDFTDGGEIVRDVNRPKHVRLLNSKGE